MGHLPNIQRYLGHTSINSHSDRQTLQKLGGGVGGLVGGPCDFSVSPSPNWTFGFGTYLGLGLGLGLGGLDLGLGLDNSIYVF